MIKTAVILAAGLGSRLKEITNNRPKGFLEIGEMSIIEESILKLVDVGVKEIIIGTGYRSEQYDQLSKKYPQIKCIYNNHYATSGSMYTLYNMKNAISNDFLLLESDLVYDKMGLRRIIDVQWADVLLTSGTTNSGDEVFVEANTQRFLANMSKDATKLNTVCSEFVGISKISHSTLEKMSAFSEQYFKQSLSLEYEQALVSIAQNRNILVLKIDDYLWSEIDNSAHLNRAKKIYSQLVRREQNEWN